MSENAPLSAPACRAARALLGWSQADLVAKAKVSPNTVAKVEAGEEVRAVTAARLLAVFDAHGVELLNGGAPGARMKAIRHGQG
jgi:transcriptional regulator with XRE-family HTH domain